MNMETSRGGREVHDPLGGEYGLWAQIVKGKVGENGMWCRRKTEAGPEVYSRHGFLTYSLQSLTWAVAENTWKIYFLKTVLPHY